MGLQILIHYLQQLLIIKGDILNKIHTKDSKSLIKIKNWSTNITLIYQKKKKVTKITIQKRRITIVRFRNNNHNKQ
jgi:hypothetical protein